MLGAEGVLNPDDLGSRFVHVVEACATKMSKQPLDNTRLRLSLYVFNTFAT